MAISTANFNELFEKKFDSDKQAIEEWTKAMVGYVNSLVDQGLVERTDIRILNVEYNANGVTSATSHADRVRSFAMLCLDVGRLDFMAWKVKKQ